MEQSDSRRSDERTVRSAARRCRWSAGRASTRADHSLRRDPRRSRRHLRLDRHPGPRVLRDAGADVVICRNVTDVDDVLLAAADRAGAPYDRFAAIQQFYFDRDMAALGVGQPAPAAAGARLHRAGDRAGGGAAGAGAAYERGGQVWFRGAAAAQRGACPDRELALRLAAEYGDDPADEGKDDPVRRRGAGGCRTAGSRAGPARGAPAGRAGTPSAPPWRCTRSARRSTCKPEAGTVSSRTTPARRPWPRRSPGSRPSPGSGSTSAWSGWPGPRWPSRPATSSWSATCSRSIPRRRYGC